VLLKWLKVNALSSNPSTAKKKKKKRQKPGQDSKCSRRMEFGFIIFHTGFELKLNWENIYLSSGKKHASNPLTEWALVFEDGTYANCPARAWNTHPKKERKPVRMETLAWLVVNLLWLESKKVQVNKLFFHPFIHPSILQHSLRPTLRSIKQGVLN
jgi:hypothetical protein